MRSYRTVSPLPRKRGGLFSVALSLGSPPAGVTRRHIAVEPGLSSEWQERLMLIQKVEPLFGMRLSAPFSDHPVIWSGAVVRVLV